MNKKVFLSVGHGGNDSGAIGNGFKEKDLNLSIALSCRAELMRHGVIVGISRMKDENDSVADEIKECNAFAPDVAVSIHNNAGGGDGAEVFYSITGSGKPLAKNIITEIVKTGQNSRGVKTRKNANGVDYYGFIRQTKPIAVIVECAFIDNAKDIQALNTNTKCKNMGVAIAKGILKYFDIDPKPQTSYRVQVGAYMSKQNAERVKSKLKTDGYDAIIVEVNNE